MKQNELNEAAIKGMNKLIFYNFNYPNVNDLIEYISECKRGDWMFDHFKSKFEGLYKANGCKAALLSFYCELDMKYRRRMLEYILDNYNHEQQI